MITEKNIDEYIEFLNLNIDLIKKKVLSITKYLDFNPIFEIRVKKIESVKTKFMHKKFNNPIYSYNDMFDLLGLRFITNTKEQVKELHDIIGEHFSIKKIEDKKITDNVKCLDYESLHLDLEIKENALKEIEIDVIKFKFINFEFQIRTFNQHSWANFSHSIMYKKVNEIPNEIQKKIYRLIAVQQIIDDEMSSITKSINMNISNDIIIFKFLESKHKEYINTYFNRDLSISNIKWILGHHTVENIDDFVKNIDAFISNNIKSLSKIKTIKEYSNTYMTLIHQPEIFLILYLSKYKRSKLKLYWEERFTDNDLNDLSNLVN